MERATSTGDVELLVSRYLAAKQSSWESLLNLHHVKLVGFGINTNHIVFYINES